MNRPMMMRMIGRAGHAAIGALVVALNGVVTIAFLALAVIAFLDGHTRAALAFVVVAAGLVTMSSHLARWCFARAESGAKTVTSDE